MKTSFCCFLLLSIYLIFATINVASSSLDDSVDNDILKYFDDEESESPKTSSNQATSTSVTLSSTKTATSLPAFSETKPKQVQTTSKVEASTKVSKDMVDKIFASPEIQRIFQATMKRIVRKTMEGYMKMARNTLQALLKKKVNTTSKASSDDNTCSCGSNNGLSNSNRNMHNCSDYTTPSSLSANKVMKLINASKQFAKILRNLSPKNFVHMMAADFEDENKTAQSSE